MSKLEKAKSTNTKITQSNIKEFQNVRIIQKNLLYVIGLSSRVCDREQLLKKEYFGQYGKIKRLVVNNIKAYNPEGINGPSYSAYISYSTIQEASLALLSIDNSIYDGHILRASFGSTKYCLHYLRNIECVNKDCLFLHNTADKEDIINKDETNNKNIFLQNQYLAMKICDIFNPAVKTRLCDKKNLIKNPEFPCPNTIYNKEIVIEEELKLKKLNKNGKTIENEIDGQSKSEILEKTNKEDLNSLFKTKEKRLKESDNLNQQNESPTNQTSNSDSSLGNPSKDRKYSDISNTSEKTNTTDSNSSKEKKKSLFCVNKEKSRFNFLTIDNSDTKKETINIPDYISRAITKITSTYFYTKSIDVNTTPFEYNDLEWNKIKNFNTNQIDI